MMKYTKQDALEYVKRENIKFIKLIFCDVFGKSKNIIINSKDLSVIFEKGFTINSKEICNLENEKNEELVLRPNSKTMKLLTNNKENTNTMLLLCDVTYPDGLPYESDSRYILKNAIKEARKYGCSFYFGSEIQFYLSKLSKKGKRTKKVYDKAEYMDIAPIDKSEKIRNEIVQVLEKMKIKTKCSYHGKGYAQNVIELSEQEPLTAADNITTLRNITKKIAFENGLYAEFGPKLKRKLPCNELKTSIVINNKKNEKITEFAINGLLKNIKDMILFFNTSKKSYKRIKKNKEIKRIIWTTDNFDYLIKYSKSQNENKTIKLRNMDSTINPYLAYALIIYASLEGIKKRDNPELPLNENFKKSKRKFEKLPKKLKKAKKHTKNSDFIRKKLPQNVVNSYKKLYKNKNKKSK